MERSVFLSKLSTWRGRGSPWGAHLGGHPEIREAWAAQKDLMTVKGGCSAVRTVTQNQQDREGSLEPSEGRLISDDTHMVGHLA